MRFVPLCRSSVTAFLLFAFVHPTAVVGQEPRSTVVVTGNEQAVVEKNVSHWERPDQDDFDNALDFVRMVLLQRGALSPNATELTRKAVVAIASVRWKQGSVPTSASEEALIASWFEQVEDSGSFSGVLQDSYWSSDNARREGVDAVIRAMLGKTGWLLAHDQAESLRKMMTDRENDVAATPRAPVPIVLKRPKRGVLYLQIPTFEDKDIGQRIVEKLRKELASGVEAVLIDLRNNAGGQPEQANAVADVFLDRKPLQKLRFANGQVVTVMSRPGASNVAVAVLINRGTGSAAEMLAMALRDNGRATLIGERTAGALFGKEGVELSDGRIALFRCEPTILSPSNADYTVSGIPPHKRHKEFATRPFDTDAAILETVDEVFSNLESTRQSAERR